MKAAGDLISAAAKFSSCVKHGKYHLHCGNPGFLVNPHRYSPAIVSDSNRIIFMNCHINCITISCKCFIHGIVHNFIYHMMKTSAGSSANIHSRNLPDSFQSFQNLNLIRGILVIHCRNIHSFFAHSYIYPSLKQSLLDILLRLICCSYK